MVDERLTQTAIKTAGLSLALLAILAACSTPDTVAGQPGSITPRLDGRVVIMGGVSSVR